MAFAALVATSTRRMHIQILTWGPHAPTPHVVARLHTEKGQTQTAAEQKLLEHLADVLNAHVDLSAFDQSTSRLPEAPIETPR